MSKTNSQGLIRHYALPLAELGYSPTEAESMMDHRLYNALSSIEQITLHQQCFVRDLLNYKIDEILVGGTQ